MEEPSKEERREKSFFATVFISASQKPSNWTFEYPTKATSYSGGGGKYIGGGGVGESSGYKYKDTSYIVSSTHPNDTRMYFRYSVEDGAHGGFTIVSPDDQWIYVTNSGYLKKTNKSTWCRIFKLFDASTHKELLYDDLKSLKEVEVIIRTYSGSLTIDDKKGTSVGAHHWNYIRAYNVLKSLGRDPKFTLKNIEFNLTPPPVRPSREDSYI
ncbi:hypothetical protein [Pseudomonas peradeniyensis]|uniref:Uncharacterized protein n=1 Tax=Pseudomonas peradeniyensis TaxID=2745488 RepID=A0ABT2VGS9_9PSED|nr:hypothetical protein [Pseudomonas peradeniyensis]MCU7240736.1 hypothetical protein [Pseudomonas peradeniyensis]MCU7279326.1 hypothetical protein [Pseudomonas peradeniyensis]